MGLILGVGGGGGGGDGGDNCVKLMRHFKGIECETSYGTCRGRTKVGKGRGPGGLGILVNWGRCPLVPAASISSLQEKSQPDPAGRACFLLMQVLISMRQLDFSFLCCKTFCSSNQQQRMILSKQLNTHPYWKQIICKQDVAWNMFWLFWILNKSVKIKFCS